MVLALEDDVASDVGITVVVVTVSTGVFVRLDVLISDELVGSTVVVVLSLVVCTVVVGSLEEESVVVVAG